MPLKTPMFNQPHENRTRIAARFIAVLYVFACVWTSLAHTHSTAVSQGQRRVSFAQGGHSTATGTASAKRCVLCDWEAACNSAAVSPVTVCVPEVFSLPLTSQICSLSDSRLIAPSSRGPP